MVTTQAGGVILGEQSLKMSQTKVPCNSQLYSEHQIIYTLRVKKSHQSKVSKHKNKPQVVEISFPIEAYE